MKAVHRTIWLMILCSTMFPRTSRSQKYHFCAYRVEQGLAQSQAYGFCQDSLDRLWIATFGGLSRFDGTQFTNLNKSDGLINDFVTCIFHDHANHIWAGTQTGLSGYDGEKFRSFTLTSGPLNVISAITEDAQGNIWTLDNYNIFRITGDQGALVSVTGKKDERITTLAADREKKIWAAVYRQGLYRLENGSWVRKVDLAGMPEDRSLSVRMLGFMPGDPGLWIVHKTGLLYFDGRQVRERVVPDRLPPGDLVTMEQDPFGKLWLVTTAGLFRLTENGFEQFNASNGFTDNPVTSIYRDKEDNFWISTIGAGIWRYSFDPFTIFESPDGGEAPIVMGIAEEPADRPWSGKSDNSQPRQRTGMQAQQTVWMGAYGKGMIRYDGHSLRQVLIPSPNADARKILCLLPGPKGDLWVGTDNGGLWRLSHGIWFRMDTKDNGLPRAVNHLAADGRGGLWMSSSLGCLHLSAEGKLYNPGIWSVCTLPLGCDSVLAGSEQGLYLIRGEQRPVKIIDSVLQSYPIQCIVSRGENIYLGTQNKGLVIWNRRTNNFRCIDTRQGLNSDVIYGLFFDMDGYLWAGTGKGIDRIRIDTVTGRFDIVNYAEPGSITSSECNQGSVMEDRAGHIWFGTTKGALRYNMHHVSVADRPVHIELFHTGGSDHPTFSFRGITFKHANDLLYRYKLEGLEENYSSWGTASPVVYAALPPGQYTFLVNAWIPGSSYPPEMQRISLRISGPFYRSKWFPYLLCCALALFLFASWMIAGRIRQARKWKVEKIRRDEYDRVRQRTSEDFHDELGNKLTRITVLTEILQNRLPPRGEAAPLVAQIKSHVGSLYEGTREILWSLTPENDSVQGMVRHIREIGTDLFHGTPVAFHYHDDMESAGPLVLNGEYSRNIIMIFKEAMNNILRHSGASNAWLNIAMLPGEGIRFELQDDGKGFDIQRQGKGYGIGNMRIRARRIDAHLQIGSAPGLGTTLRLRVRTRTN